MIQQPTRRSVLRGLSALVCAPAIVRASSLMPVKAWADDYELGWTITDPITGLTTRGTFAKQFAALVRDNNGMIIRLIDGGIYKSEFRLPA